MKKNIFALAIVLSLSSLGYAQSDNSRVSAEKPAPQAAERLQRVSIDLRGGLAASCGSSDIFTHQVGGNVLLDAQYALYWRSKNTYLGFMVGAGLGFTQTGAQLNGVNDKYTISTDDGVINYSISASQIVECQQSLNVEIPIMFSLVDQSGVFFNFGPRLAFPIGWQSSVSFTDANIQAYFPEEGVLVPNEVITGKVGDGSKPQSAQWNAPIIRVLLGTEIGYEWAFNNGNALGLGAYADCEVGNFQKATDATKSFISITSPSASAPAAVTIQSPTDHYASTLGMFAVGIKLAYHFRL